MIIPSPLMGEGWGEGDNPLSPPPPFILSPPPPFILSPRPPFILSLSKDPPVISPWRGVRGVRLSPHKPRTIASRLSSARLIFSWLLAYDSRT